MLHLQKNIHIEILYPAYFLKFRISENGYTNLIKFQRKINNVRVYITVDDLIILMLRPRS